jgi:NADH dehydrogenase [ubiquinone] 1 alpha subcomplex assembly factor 6
MCVLLFSRDRSVAEHTTVSSLYLSLEACNVRNAAADHAASHIGKALFLLDRVEELRVALLHGGSVNGPLPSAILKAHGVQVGQLASVSDMQSEDEKEKLLAGITDVAYELAARAHGHIAHARDLAPTVPAEAAPVLRLAHIAAGDLDVLEQCQWELADPRIAAHRNSGLVRFQAELVYASWKGTY